MRVRYVLWGDYYTEETEDKDLARKEAQRIVEEKAMEIGANVDSVDILEDIIKGITEGGKNGE